MIDAALKYAERGWPIIPLHSIKDDTCTCNKSCSSPSKHPRLRNGVKGATTNQSIITKWWGKWPDANIGIATGKQSGLIVLDVDPDHGGSDSLQELTDSYGELETLSQNTGGNGKHYLFTYPPNVDAIKNSAGKIGGGLDIRADNGYIVAPPSNHKSGNLYRWETDKPLSDIPNWLLFLITEEKKQPEHTEAITEGNRNNYLARIGGKLRNEGKSRKQLEIALLEENKIKCNPPLDDSEVSKIAASISKYPAKPKPFLFSWRELVMSENGPSKPTTRYTLLALATHMDAQGRSCYPTIKQLVIESTLSEKTVRKHIHYAKNEGWIDIYEHQGKGQAWKNHGYIAKIPAKMRKETLNIEV